MPRTQSPDTTLASRIDMGSIVGPTSYERIVIRVMSESCVFPIVKVSFLRFLKEKKILKLFSKAKQMNPGISTTASPSNII